MLNDYLYHAIIERGDDGAYLVSFPDFPEALAFGNTYDEAKQNAPGCLREAVRGRIRDNEDIPAPSQSGDNAILVALPAPMAVKAAVYQAFKKGKLTRVALADKLDLNEGEIRRILDPSHGTKLERLDQVAHALGGRLEVRFVPN